MTSRKPRPKSGRSNLPLSTLNATGAGWFALRRAAAGTQTPATKRKESPTVPKKYVKLAERFPDAVPQPACGHPPVRRSCCWCNLWQVVGRVEGLVSVIRPTICGQCGHRADVARKLCDCRKCKPVRAPALSPASLTLWREEEPEEGGDE